MRKITLSALMLLMANNVLAEEQPAPDVSFRFVKSSTPAGGLECLNALENGRILPHGGDKDGRGTLFIIYDGKFFVFDLLSTPTTMHCTKVVARQE
jgi:hypothetical protein